MPFGNALTIYVRHNWQADFVQPHSTYLSTNWLTLVIAGLREFYVQKAFQTKAPKTMKVLLVPTLVASLFAPSDNVQVWKISNIRPKHKRKQECIPVGCVPAARRPYAGVCFPGGYAWSGGVSAPGGLPSLGGSAWSGGVCLVQGGVCLVRGCVPGPGGVCLVWEGSAWSGGCVSAPGRVYPSMH